MGASSAIATRLASQVVRLGFYMGYAPPGTNPLELDRARAGGRAARLRLGLGGGGVGDRRGQRAHAGSPRRRRRSRSARAILQIPGRTPANTAMTAATLDLLSGGRFLLGLGTSGPQVVEGWHGEPWGKPLTKTREYVEIVRTVLRRETARAPRRALRHPVLGARRDGPRQAAEADGAPAPRGDPDLPRVDGAEVGRARVRDRGRLDPALLLSRSARARSSR